MSMPLHRVSAVLAAVAVAVALASCASTSVPRSTGSVTGSDSPGSRTTPAHGQPSAAEESSVASSPMLATASPDAPSGQRPLPGPDVLAADLFTGGHGYVRTTDALLWTDDFGASWRKV